MAPDNENSSPKRAVAESGRPGAAVKVELDIEDAPFLEEEEEEKKPPPPKAAEAPPPQLPREKAPAPGLADKLALFFSNKKRLAVIGGGLAVLLIAPLVLMLLFSGKKDAPPPQEPQRITASATPPRVDAPPGPKFLYKADRFLVPLRGSEGEIRFLRCDFTVPTDNPQLFAELVAKNIVVRDSIYYYLSNKPLSFLSDQMARQALKQDLISVINEHVSAEKISELLFENYLISGK